ncbi:MAG: hypothetical protein Kow0096_06430 [Thiohalomonadaceae bacterium]
MEKTAVKLMLTLAVGALLVLAASGAPDRAGFEYTERSFKRALVTFAVVRGLNAVISVAQGTEIAVEPAGVGVNFAPGQVLDPVNDLVEQFSWVMLASATALGLQRLLLELFATTGFTGLLATAWALALLLLWLPRLAPRARAWLLRLGLLLLALRFVVPLLALTGELFYSGFLHERYAASTERIEQVTGTIREINEGAEREAAAAEVDPSLLERMRRAYQSAMSALDVGSYLDRYEQAAADVSEQVVNLIVVFLVQTVLLPWLFLWALLRGIGWLWRLPLPAADGRAVRVDAGDASGQ